MRKTPEEISELQRLFDEHLAHANPHMTAIVTPERRLTAEQVARYLEGTRIVAFATVTPKGQPRVSPLDSLFLHGRLTLSTDVTATRIAHLRANAACSAVYMEADRIAVVANGTVEWITREHIDHDEIHAAWTATYHSDPYTWGDVVLFRIAQSRCGPTPSAPRTSRRRRRPEPLSGTRARASTTARPDRRARIPARP